MRHTDILDPASAKQWPSRRDHEFKGGQAFSEFPACCNPTSKQGALGMPIIRTDSGHAMQ
jgi:hypothetical protein